MHRFHDTCWSYATLLHTVPDHPFHFVIDFPENNGRTVFFLVPVINVAWPPLF